MGVFITNFDSKDVETIQESRAEITPIHEEAQEAFDKMFEESDEAFDRLFRETWRKNRNEQG